MQHRKDTIYPHQQRVHVDHPRFEPRLPEPPPHDYRLPHNYRFVMGPKQSGDYRPPHFDPRFYHVKPRFDVPGPPRPLFDPHSRNMPFHRFDSSLPRGVDNHRGPALPFDHPGREGPPKPLAHFSSRNDCTDPAANHHHFSKQFDYHAESHHPGHRFQHQTDRGPAHCRTSSPAHGFDRLDGGEIHKLDRHGSHEMLSLDHPGGLPPIEPQHTFDRRDHPPQNFDHARLPPHKFDGLGGPPAQFDGPASHLTKKSVDYGGGPRPIIDHGRYNRPQMCYHGRNPPRHEIDGVRSPLHKFDSLDGPPGQFEHVDSHPTQQLADHAGGGPRPNIDYGPHFHPEQFDCARSPSHEFARGAIIPLREFDRARFPPPQFDHLDSNATQQLGRVTGPLQKSDHPVGHPLQNLNGPDRPPLQQFNRHGSSTPVPFDHNRIDDTHPSNEIQCTTGQITGPVPWKHCPNSNKTKDETGGGPILKAQHEQGRMYDSRIQRGRARDRRRSTNRTSLDGARKRKARSRSRSPHRSASRSDTSPMAKNRRDSRSSRGSSKRKNGAESDRRRGSKTRKSPHETTRPSGDGRTESDRRRESKTRKSPHEATRRSGDGRKEPDRRRRSKTRKSPQKTTRPTGDESGSDCGEEAGGAKLDVEQEIASLKASYTQCTQHGNLYLRVMTPESTVRGTPKLEKLYDKFEKQLANRHENLWEPPSNKDKTTANSATSGSVQLNMEVVKSWTAEEEQPLSLTKRRKIKGIKKKFKALAQKKRVPVSQFIDDTEPTVPSFAVGELRTWLERRALSSSDEGELTSSSSDDEAHLNENVRMAGEQIDAIRKLKAHKDRLHLELWYNEPGQVNDGALCRCSKQRTRSGICHNIYPGEPSALPCNPMENNIGKMFHYRIAVGPTVNFMVSAPTTIVHNGNDFYFEGFSLFSHVPLKEIPYCDLIRFHIRYTIYLIDETPPENFCDRGLQLFEKFLFREVLELYDWQASEPASRKFRFFPRFVRALPENGKEILSLCCVLQHLLDSDLPLVDPDQLADLMRLPEPKWLEFTEKIRGMLVTFPGKRPSTLRCDQLDRDHTTPVESDPAVLPHPVDARFPIIVHFGIRPANMCYAGDQAFQKISRNYMRHRHLVKNANKVKASDLKKLLERENAMEKLKRTKELAREVTVEVSSKGFRRTGIFGDLCQHAALLPVLTHHLRYNLCLATLEKKIGYQFKERKWLSHAMNHPSYQMNFGLNPDHVRNTLTNCGVRVPQYGDNFIHYKYTRKHGVTTLIRIMARLGEQRPLLSPIEHNERLEFLGDAVVGYLTSVHLFFMFPDLSEGALSTFRMVLVNNQHLAVLAERLGLDKFMVYSHGPDLRREADLRHAMANCFEALMGAVYMEAGLEKAKELFGKFLWEEPELRKVWQNLPLHPLQAEVPTTDRHFIPQVPILQRMEEFEKSIGVRFRHIRLLAKSFTWRSVHDNLLTGGHNQRLEFLGDSICNLLASSYLFELYPTHHEGHLTLLRATVVNGHTQAQVAQELGMPKFVIYNLSEMSNGSTMEPDWNEKSLADLLEAFVAALFIDRGLRFVDGLMKVCFFPRLKEFILSQDWNDPKSCLQQCCLTLRKQGKEAQVPRYQLVPRTGPAHRCQYQSEVVFAGVAIGRGEGRTIQVAEREAARDALDQYKFPQLEWQRKYIANKHKFAYKPKKNLKLLSIV